MNSRSRQRIRAGQVIFYVMKATLGPSILEVVIDGGYLHTVGIVPMAEGQADIVGFGA